MPASSDPTLSCTPEDCFLNDKNDVRSCYALEDAGTEFDVQGLELDWTGACWDGDFRYLGQQWSCNNFKGTKWQSVKDPMRQLYLKNAYRVILTRARQGMVIFVPKGDDSDPTRKCAFYDHTFKYLKLCGIPEMSTQKTLQTLATAENFLITTKGSLI